MNKFLSLSTWIVVVTLIALPAISSALDITNISGTWTSTTGGKNLTGVDTNQINWGGSNQTTAQKSGYNFTPSPNLYNVDPGSDFVLGTFTHINKVITSSSDAITKAVLTFTLSIPNVISNLTISYVFNHDETPNVHCSGTSCDDIVTLASNPVVTKDFMLDGQLYTLTIKGFEINGQTLTQFLTQENKNNSASLIAEITADGITTVTAPEPATYLILGSTLGLIMLFKRHQLKIKKATLEK